MLQVHKLCVEILLYPTSVGKKWTFDVTAFQDPPQNNLEGKIPLPRNSETYCSPHTALMSHTKWYYAAASLLSGDGQRATYF